MTVDCGALCASTKVDIPDPKSRMRAGLELLASSNRVSNTSGDAAQLRVAGIGAFKSNNLMSWA